MDDNNSSHYSTIILIFVTNNLRVFSNYLFYYQLSEVVGLLWFTDNFSRVKLPNGRGDINKACSPLVSMHQIGFSGNFFLSIDSSHLNFVSESVLYIDTAPRIKKNW